MSGILSTIARIFCSLLLSIFLWIIVYFGVIHSLIYSKWASLHPVEWEAPETKINQIIQPPEVFVRERIVEIEEAPDTSPPSPEEDKVWQKTNVLLYNINNTLRHQDQVLQRVEKSLNQLFQQQKRLKQAQIPSQDPSSALSPQSVDHVFALLQQTDLSALGNDQLESTFQHAFQQLDSLLIQTDEQIRKQNNGPASLALWNNFLPLVDLNYPRITPNVDDATSACKEKWQAISDSMYTPNDSIARASHLQEQSKYWSSLLHRLGEELPIDLQEEMNEELGQMQHQMKQVLENTLDELPELPLEWDVDIPPLLPLVNPEEEQITADDTGTAAAVSPPTSPVGDTSKPSKTCLRIEDLEEMLEDALDAALATTLDQKDGESLSQVLTRWIRQLDPNHDAKDLIFDAILPTATTTSTTMKTTTRREQWKPFSLNVRRDMLNHPGLVQGLARVVDALVDVLSGHNDALDDFVDQFMSQQQQQQQQQQGSVTAATSLGQVVVQHLWHWAGHLHLPPSVAERVLEQLDKLPPDVVETLLPPPRQQGQSALSR